MVFQLESLLFGLVPLLLLLLKLKNKTTTKQLKNILSFSLRFRSNLLEFVLLALRVVRPRYRYPHRLPEHQLARLHLRPDPLRQRSPLRRLLLQQLLFFARRPPLDLLLLFLVPRQHLVSLQDEYVLDLSLHQLVLLVDLLFFDFPERRFARPRQLLLLLKELSLHQRDLLPVRVAQSSQRTLVSLVQPLQERFLLLQVVGFHFLLAQLELELATLLRQQIDLGFHQSRLLLETLAEQFQLAFLLASYLLRHRPQVGVLVGLGLLDLHLLLPTQHLQVVLVGPFQRETLLFELLVLLLQSNVLFEGQVLELLLFLLLQVLQFSQLLFPVVVQVRQVVDLFVAADHLTSGRRDEDSVDNKFPGAFSSFPIYIGQDRLFSFRRSLPQHDRVLGLVELRQPVALRLFPVASSTLVTSYRQTLDVRLLDTLAYRNRSPVRVVTAHGPAIAVRPVGEGRFVTIRITLPVQAVLLVDVVTARSVNDLSVHLGLDDRLVHVARPVQSDRRSSDLVAEVALAASGLARRRVRQVAGRTSEVVARSVAQIRRRILDLHLLLVDLDHRHVTGVQESRAVVGYVETGVVYDVAGIDDQDFAFVQFFGFQGSVPELAGRGILQRVQGGVTLVIRRFHVSLVGLVRHDDHFICTIVRGCRRSRQTLSIVDNDRWMCRNDGHLQHNFQRKLNDSRRLLYLTYVGSQTVGRIRKVRVDGDGGSV